MPETRKVAVLVGSLRKGSYNRMAAHALGKLAPQSMAMEIIEIGDLPLYDEDVEAEGSPSTWTTFRQAIARAEAVLFVTPEYNRSVPGVLKNALDVGSRPHGRSVWSHKPAAIMTLSLGAMGGFGANHHLRQSLVFLDMPTLQQPEAYVGHAATLFRPDGEFASEGSKAFFQTFIDAFALLIARADMTITV